MKNTDPPDENQREAQSKADINRFIEGMGSYFENEGVPRIGGRILGLLLASEKPLSAEQLAARLKVSRASISTNIRILTTSGLVEKMSFLDHRHTFYSITGDVWGRAITAGHEKVLAFRSLAEMGLAAMPEVEAVRQRLQEMIDWSDTMTEVFEKVLVEWQARRSVGTPAGPEAG